MLELKDAIKKAFELLEVLYEGQKLQNRLLEEIEYDEESNTWKVVIGFDSDRIQTRTEGAPLFPSRVREKERKFKQIRLSGNDGSFIKMVDQML